MKEKTMNPISRHGDVLLVDIDMDVDGAIDETRTLAEGEVTGHYHRIEGDKGSVVINFDAQKHSMIQEAVRDKIEASMSPEARKHWSRELVEVVKFLKPKIGDRLVHNEHKALSIGDEKARAVVIQRDYRPQGYTKVID